MDYKGICCGWWPDNILYCIQITVLKSHHKMSQNERVNSLVGKNYPMVQWDDGVTIFNHDLIKKLLNPFNVVYT